MKSSVKGPQGATESHRIVTGETLQVVWASDVWTKMGGVYGPSRRVRETKNTPSGGPNFIYHRPVTEWPARFGPPATMPKNHGEFDKPQLSHPDLKGHSHERFNRIRVIRSKATPVAEVHDVRIRHGYITGRCRPAGGSPQNPSGPRSRRDRPVAAFGTADYVQAGDVARVI